MSYVVVVISLSVPPVASYDFSSKFPFLKVSFVGRGFPAILQVNVTEDSLSSSGPEGVWEIVASAFPTETQNGQE